MTIEKGTAGGSSSKILVSRKSTLRRHLKGSNFQLLSGVKKYVPKSYDDEEDGFEIEEHYELPRKFSSMRTVKSAPFKKELCFENVGDELSGDETCVENELKRSLYDQIDNASLFSDRTTASVKNYNYKNVLEKHPSLKHEAENVRQRLFRNYMKVFEETSSNFKENAHSYEKNDIKNASSEISNLIFSFERDSTNRVFIESRNKRVRELKAALDAIEARKIEKAKRAAAKLEAENVAKTTSTTLKSEPTRKVSVFSASSGESKTSSKHSKQHMHAVKRVSESRPNVEERSVVFADPVVVDKTEAVNSYDDFDDYLVDSMVEEDTNTKKVKITDDAPSVVVFNQNDDEKFYNRNRHKFSNNIEQAHKSMYRFARQASDKLDKLCPRPDRPKLRTASELNIDEDSLKKQIRLKRIARMLENADEHAAPVNISERQRANSTVSKIASLNKESEDDDDDYGDEDDDEANRRRYRMKMKKTQNYVKVLKYMYAKSQKNQKKIDGILSKGQNANEDFPQKQVLITEEAGALAHSPLLQVAIPTEDYREAASQKQAFRISVPFKRDNISNYEIFIPNQNLTSYSLLSGRSTSSTLSNNRFYDLSSNITSGLGEYEKKLLPLTIDALKVSGLKVLEPKAKSIYWQNYNKTSLKSVEN